MARIQESSLWVRCQSQPTKRDVQHGLWHGEQRSHPPLDLSCPGAGGLTADEETLLPKLLHLLIMLITLQSSSGWEAATVAGIP